jgi:hypothetical protein
MTDPAVPAVSCPAPVLASGTSETCTGSYTTTSADLAAGKITDTATAAGATSNGVPVAFNAAAVTVAEGWPPAVSGDFRRHGPVTDQTVPGSWPCARGRFARSTGLRAGWTSGGKPVARRLSHGFGDQRCCAAWPGSGCLPLRAF